MGRKPGPRDPYGIGKRLLGTPRTEEEAKIAAGLIQMEQDAIELRRERGVDKGRRPIVDTLDPKDVSKYIRFAMVAGLDLPPLNHGDPQAVADRCRQYLEACANEAQKPSVAGLALWLGVGRQTLWTWHNSSDPYGPAHKAIIDRYYALLDAVMNDLFQDSKVNPVAAIFLMKNNFSYRDQAELVMSTRSPLGELPDAGRIYADYVEKMPDEIEDDNNSDS